MNPRGPDPRPLPDSLGDGFSVRDARAEGLTDRRLRSASLESPYWGLRARTDLDTVEDRCRLMARRMPDFAFFSHVTAAVLHGLPLPPRLERSTRLDIGTPHPHRAPHATGIIGHQLTIEPYDLCEVRGLRATTPARTWCDLGSVLSLMDLVAAGDFVVRRNAPLATIADLAEVAHARVSPRGRQNILNALPLLRNRSESPRESVLRVLLGQAGFPEPKLNHEFFDANGRFIARVDIYLEPLNLVLEYQGDYHRTDKNQWRRDMTRREELAAIGVRSMEVNSDDLISPAHLAGRIRKRAALAN